VKLILLLSCIVLVVGHVAEAQSPQPPWRLEPQNTTPISVPAEIRRAVGIELRYYGKAGRSKVSLLTSIAMAPETICCNRPKAYAAPAGASTSCGTERPGQRLASSSAVR
jgi:hypothetical protein